MSPSPPPSLLQSQFSIDIGSTSTIVQQLMYNFTETVSITETDDNGLVDHDLSTSSLIHYRLMYRNYHGFISSVVCLFGLTCNLFNIIVLTRPLMRSSTNTILTSLALSDLLKMLFVLPAVILFYCLPKDEMKSEPDPTSYFQVRFYMMYMLFTLTLHCISTWLTVYLAGFRYVFLSCKRLKPYVSAPERSLVGVTVVVLLSTILCIPSYMEHQIVQDYVNNTPISPNDTLTIKIYRFDQTAFSKSLALRDKVFVLHGVLFKLIPCFLLLVFSFLLIQQLHVALKKAQNLQRHFTHSKKEKNSGRLRSRKRENENRRTTLMLVIVCVLFLVTELPQGAILFLTFLSKDRSGYYFQIYQHLGDTFDILALINNSVNFILYCLMSKSFRDTFKQIFCMSSKLEPNQSTIAFSKVTIRKHRAKNSNKTDNSVKSTTCKSYQNGRIHVMAIKKCPSDCETKRIKRTIKPSELNDRMKSASF